MTSLFAIEAGNEPECKFGWDSFQHTALAISALDKATQNACISPRYARRLRLLLVRPLHEGASYYGACLRSERSHDQRLKFAMFDAGTTNYATYIIYGATGTPLGAALINSDFYDGTPPWGTEVFALSGLTMSMVKAKRLTAPELANRVDQGSSPSFGGQEFENRCCVKIGAEAYETTTVSSGQANLPLTRLRSLRSIFRHR